MCKCPVCGSEVVNLPEIIVSEDCFIYVKGQRINGVAYSTRQIFALLYKRMGRVVAKETIYEQLYWDRLSGGEVEPKIIDVFMCKMRKWIKKTPIAEYVEIETVWGRGFLMKRVKK